MYSASCLAISSPAFVAAIPPTVVKAGVINSLAAISPEVKPLNVSDILCPVPTASAFNLSSPKPEGAVDAPAVEVSKGE